MNVHNVVLGGPCENHSCSSKIVCSINATVMSFSFHTGQCSHIINQLLNHERAWFICSQLYSVKISHTIGCSVTCLCTLLAWALGESSTESQKLQRSSLHRHLPNCRKRNLHPILLQIMPTRFSKRCVFHASSTTHLHPQNLYPNFTRQCLMSLYITLASSLPHLFHSSGHRSHCTAAVYPWGPHLPCCSITMTAHPDNPGQSCHSFDNRRLYLSH